jgi:hypothetical protein
MHRSFTPYFTTPVNSKQRKSTAKRIQLKPSLTTRGKSAIENTVRYIGVCCDPGAYRSVVRAAPDAVLKTICNAALNVERGEINLSQAQKTLFRRHKQQIARLTSRRVALPSKRRILEQRGGAFWIPALIGAAISGLGSAIFGGNKS